MKWGLCEDHTHCLMYSPEWRKVMLLLIGKVAIQLYESTCVYDVCVHNILYQEVNTIADILCS